MGLVPKMQFGREVGCLDSDSIYSFLRNGRIWRFEVFFDDVVKDGTRWHIQIRYLERSQNLHQYTGSGCSAVSRLDGPYESFFVDKCWMVLLIVSSRSILVTLCSSQ